jgi:hypothetical protein
VPRPIRHARRQIRLPNAAEYSAQQVGEFLDEEVRNGFRTAIPEGCNFVLVQLDRPVAKAMRDRERAFLAAQKAQR